MKAYPAAALLAALASAAAADPRIASRLYHPSEVVAVHGRAGVESTIAFDDDERIENVAVGDSAAWQVTPNKRGNLVFVKPAKPGARSNMTVVTDQRTYLFDLVANGTAPVYMLRFTYPPKPRQASVLPGPAKPTPDEIALAAAVAASAMPPPAPPPDPARLDFGWEGKGDKALLPTRAYDDGRSVYLAWGGDVTLPAILVREANGQEGPVNYTVRDGVIVVDGVPGELVLRSGKRMATLTATRALPPEKSTAKDKSAALARAEDK